MPEIDRGLRPYVQISIKASLFAPLLISLIEDGVWHRGTLQGGLVALSFPIVDCGLLNWAVQPPLEALWLVFEGRTPPSDGPVYPSCNGVQPLCRSWCFSRWLKKPAPGKGNGVFVRQSPEFHHSAIFHSGWPASSVIVD